MDEIMMYNFFRITILDEKKIQWLGLFFSFLYVIHVTIVSANLNFFLPKKNPENVTISELPESKMELMSK